MNRVHDKIMVMITQQKQEDKKRNYADNAHNIAYTFADDFTKELGYVFQNQNIEKPTNSLNRALHLTPPFFYFPVH